MAAPYSIDLREKIVEQYNVGDYTQEEVTSIFGISISTLKRWLKKQRESGNLHPRKGLKGRPAKIDDVGLHTIKKAVKANNAITLVDLSDIYIKKHNIKLSTSILARALIKLKLNRKKLSVTSTEKDSPEAKKKIKLYTKS